MINSSREKVVLNIPTVVARGEKSLLCDPGRYRVCGNRPRTALAFSKNYEYFAYTDRRTVGLASLLLREVHEARLPRTCSRPCAFKVKKMKRKKKRNPTRH